MRKQVVRSKHLTLSPYIVMQISRRLSSRPISLMHCTATVVEVSQSGFLLESCEDVGSDYGVISVCFFVIGVLFCDHLAGQGLALNDRRCKVKCIFITFTSYMVFSFSDIVTSYELTRSKSEDNQVFVLPHTDSTSLVSEFERIEPMRIVSLDDLDLPQEPTNENTERSLVPYRPIIPIYSQDNTKKVPYHQFFI